MTLTEKSKALKLQELLKQIQLSTDWVEVKKAAQEADKIVKFLIDKE